MFIFSRCRYRYRSRNRKKLTESKALRAKVFHQVAPGLDETGELKGCHAIYRRFLPLSSKAGLLSYSINVKFSG
jgi:hypothetical protein